MDLAALKAFNRVATHGGFGQANRATGQPKATLSRHVRELEDSLGVRLIERGPRALRLTEEGTALHARTDNLIAEIEEAGQAIGGGLARPRGWLRVSTTVAFAHVAMGRIAADFASQHPEIRLEVVMENRFVDLVAEGFDAVIRIDPRPEHGVVGRCFLRDQMLVVAPASFACPPPGNDGAAGPVSAVVLTGAPDEPVWHLGRGGHAVTIRADPVLRLSSPLMVRDAVRAGAEAALLPRSMVTKDLAARHLVEWGAAAQRAVEIWVLHTSRRLVGPKVEAFVRFLCAAFPDGAL